MKFDNNKVYTNLDADLVKIGSKAVFADNLVELYKNVENNINCSVVTNIISDIYDKRFVDEHNCCWSIVYLISKEEK